MVFGAQRKCRRVGVLWGVGELGPLASQAFTYSS